MLSHYKLEIATDLPRRQAGSQILKSVTINNFLENLLKTGNCVEHRFDVKDVADFVSTNPQTKIENDLQIPPQLKSLVFLHHVSGSLLVFYVLPI